MVIPPAPSAPPCVNASMFYVDSCILSALKCDVAGFPNSRLVSSAVGKVTCTPNEHANAILLTYIMLDRLHPITLQGRVSLAPYRKRLGDPQYLNLKRGEELVIKVYKL